MSPYLTVKEVAADLRIGQTKARELLSGPLARRIWTQLGAPPLMPGRTRPCDLGFVYFIEALGARRLKIGWSQAPHRRCGQLQTHSPHRLRLLAAIEGTRDHEHWLHTFCAEARDRGEWFHVRVGLRDFAEVIHSLARVS